MTDVDELVAGFVQWAEARPDVAGVALVGSHARGAARADSDVDILIVTDDPPAYFAQHGWVATFGAVASVTVEEWGAVTSLRVRYGNGREVEVGLAPVSWASIDPVGAGTTRVVSDGFRILFDPMGLLERLRQAVTN